MTRLILIAALIASLASTAMADRTAGIGPGNDRVGQPSEPLAGTDLGSGR